MRLAVFAKSCLRDMGDLIESCLFPFITLRLKVLDFAGKLPKNSHRIDDLTLGSAIAKLSPIDRALYCPEPFKVPLSQWRNISHHSSYKVVNDAIWCEYGHRRARRQFECSAKQLHEVLEHVNNLYYLHKVAYEVFCTDNVQALAETIRSTNAMPKPSEFTTHATLAYSIVASGFHIRNAAQRGFSWALVLRDRHDRSKEDFKAALQTALVPYLILKGRTQINAWVDSQESKHFVSFVGEIEGPDTRLRKNEHTSFRIGIDFWIEGSSD